MQVYSILLMPIGRIAKSMGVMPDMLHKVGWLEVTGNLNFNLGPYRTSK